MKPAFKLADNLGDNIKRQFYEEELQPNEDDWYLIEGIILNRETQPGSQEFPVKWKGWPTKLNSWVKEEDCAYTQKSKDVESDWGIHANITK